MGRALGVFLLGLACASTGAAPRWDTTGETGGYAQRVVGTEVCLDAFSDARCKVWYRAGTDPIAGAMWFLVAQSGDACAVDSAMFAMAVIGDQFTCRWRRPR